MVQHIILRSANHRTLGRSLDALYDQVEQVKYYSNGLTVSDLNLVFPNIKLERLNPFIS